MLSSFSDIHSHLRQGEEPRPDTVYSMMPGQWPSAPGTGHYSVGVHPMYLDEATVDDELARVAAALDDDRVVAVGECGLDRRAAAPEALQEDVLRRHAQWALERDMPLIIHCVGRWGRLLEVLRPFLARGLKAVVHGFRGKPQLAAQLLHAGLDLSYGPLRNQASYDLTPPARRHYDSDGR